MVVFGVNDRSSEDAAEWVERESLPFDVLVDSDRSIATKFGISQPDVEKYVANNAEGRRPVVVIDRDGKVLKALPDVMSVEDQLAALKDL
ncbi:MAG: redoxin domain-containing protein [Chloroflexi bacterium]|nr:redoxin domain-containing protein [Chloroflexota bacterium]